jgi:hypothetical protein
LLGWCIRGRRCVMWWNHGAVTLELCAVTLNLKFPSVLYLLNEWRFVIGICRDNELWGIVALWPLTLAQWPWTWNSLLLCISWTDEDTLLVFAAMMYLGTTVCHVVECYCKEKCHTYSTGHNWHTWIHICYAQRSRSLCLSLCAQPACRTGTIYA